MARIDPDEQLTSIEYDVLQRVLSKHPVRFALVFGSQVRGDAHATSDVDLAVEFDDSVSEQEYADARLGLIADLTSALGQNEIDVADLEDMKPAVGKSAFEHGVVIVGSRDEANRYLEQFTQAIPPSNRTRRERFDDLLTQIEELPNMRRRKKVFRTVFFLVSRAPNYTTSTKLEQQQIQLRSADLAAAQILRL